MLDRLRQRLADAMAPAAKQPPIGAGATLMTGPGGAPPQRGTAELLRAYSTMPWLRAVVHKVSKSVAMTTWKLFVVRRGAEGRAVRLPKLERADFATRRKLLATLEKRGELVELDDHPLLELLSAGNDLFSGTIAFQVTQQHLDLVGEAFWILERNGAGKPAALWPLPPDWVRETPAPGTAAFRVAVGANHAQIPASEMVWLYEPDPSDPYGLTRRARGSGTARALADELETDEYAAKHAKQWFYNNAAPSFIATVENASQEEIDRLEARWIEKHQGFLRHFRPQFLNRKIEIKELSQTFRNMQLVDLRKLERDTIIQVFGLPPEILGIIENSNRATIEAADFLFTRWVIVPRLEFLRAALQARLVPEFDERLILDYESPVAEDKAHRLEVMRASPWAYSANEWRRRAGFAEEAEGGDVHMVPAELVPTGDLGAGALEPGQGVGHGTDRSVGRGTEGSEASAPAGDGGSRPTAASAKGAAANGAVAGR